MFWVNLNLFLAILWLPYLQMSELLRKMFSQRNIYAMSATRSSNISCCCFFSWIIASNLQFQEFPQWFWSTSAAVSHIFFLSLFYEKAAAIFSCKKIFQVKLCIIYSHLGSSRLESAWFRPFVCLQNIEMESYTSLFYIWNHQGNWWK